MRTEKHKSKKEGSEVKKRKEVRRASRNKGGEGGKGGIRKGYEMEHEGHEEKKDTVKKMQVITTKDTRSNHIVIVLSSFSH